MKFIYGCDQLMILAIGEILFDTFPKYRRIGGAPFNFAFHLCKLGFDARFWSRVGEDDDGRAILDYMSDKGIDASLVQKDKVSATGIVLISLGNAGNADYSILPGAAYDSLELTDAIVKTVEESDLIYFGSLIQRTPRGFATVHNALAKRKSGSLLMYDVNIRKGCFSQTIIIESLKKCDIFKLNEGELKEISDMFLLKGSADDCIRQIMDSYAINMVSLTCGSGGSYLYSRDAGRCYVGPESGITIKDTVGAGDGYSAMLCAGMLRGWKPQIIVEKASLFASRICEIEGAIPEQESFYAKSL
jgi:fructokinase